VMYKTGFGLYLNSTVRFAGKVAVNDANTTFSSEYTVVDLKAGYSSILSKLELYDVTIEPYVHVNNLFDRRYVGSFAINAFGGRYYEPSPERSIYVGLQVAL
jgi:iron complex outermembrane recepter protein